MVLHGDLLKSFGGSVHCCKQDVLFILRRELVDEDGTWFHVDTVGRIQIHYDLQHVLFTPGQSRTGIELAADVLLPIK